MHTYEHACAIFIRCHYTNGTAHFFSLEKASNINKRLLERLKSSVSSAQRLQAAGGTQSSHARRNDLLCSDPWRGEDVIAQDDHPCVRACVFAKCLHEWLWGDWISKEVGAIIKQPSEEEETTAEQECSKWDSRWLDRKLEELWQEVCFRGGPASGTERKREIERGWERKKLMFPVLWRALIKDPRTSQFSVQMH